MVFMVGTSRETGGDLVNNYGTLCWLAAVSIGVIFAQTMSFMGCVVL
jgi:hypothetical protein